VIPDDKPAFPKDGREWPVLAEIRNGKNGPELLGVIGAAECDRNVPEQPPRRRANAPNLPMLAPVALLSDVFSLTGRGGQPATIHRWLEMHGIPNGRPYAYGTVRGWMTKLYREASLNRDNRLTLAGQNLVNKQLGNVLE
jgi:hypothetical protein